MNSNRRVFSAEESETGKDGRCICEKSSFLLERHLRRPSQLPEVICRAWHRQIPPDRLLKARQDRADLVFTETLYIPRSVDKFHSLRSKLLPTDWVHLCWEAINDQHHLPWPHPAKSAVRAKNSANKASYQHAHPSQYSLKNVAFPDPA